ESSSGYGLRSTVHYLTAYGCILCEVVVFLSQRQALVQGLEPLELSLGLSLDNPSFVSAVVSCVSVAVSAILAKSVLLRPVPRVLAGSPKGQRYRNLRK
ncbi:MAG: hypothetical protein ACK5Z0_07105, partial [Planctomycetota bacterium]